MLKNSTIEELKNVFDEAVQDDLHDLDILPGPSVEVVNLDLIRIHINAAVHPEYIKDIIFDILRRNQEPGPLTIHPETATSCRLLFYVDIINDI